MRFAPGGVFTGSSCFDEELKSSPHLAVNYVIAPPRMALYMEYSTRIYKIYMKYIAPEDAHVYSIDEIFLDVTQYLDIYGMTARQLAEKIIREECVSGNRNHRNGRDWFESLFVKNCHGYCCKAYSAR